MSTTNCTAKGEDSHSHKPPGCSHEKLQGKKKEKKKETHTHGMPPCGHARCNLLQGRTASCADERCRRGAASSKQASRHCCIIHEVHIVSSSIHGQGTSTRSSRASSSSLPSPYCCNVLYRPSRPPSSHPRAANNQKHRGGGAVMCLRVSCRIYADAGCSF